MDKEDLLRRVMNPPILAEKEDFAIKMAENEEEVEKVFRLRYEVFNLEQGKGLESATEQGVDRDEFDDHCCHLVVMDNRTAKPVGTYRIHLGPIAAETDLGFYSAREYEMTGFEPFAIQAIEVGRSCVHPDYRSGAAVGLLWMGISQLLFRSGLRYLFGCVSLEETDPAAGWALYEHFRETDKISDQVSGVPTAEYRMDRPDEKAIQAIARDRARIKELVPPLFKGYLRLGAKICGEPAYDDEFGTIDFLILLDTRTMPERYIRHFRVPMGTGG